MNYGKIGSRWLCRKVFQVLRGGLHLQLHDWETRQAENVTFFSSYDFSTRNGDRLVTNEYRHLREMLSDKPAIDQVMFLGQCLVDDHWMDKDAYFKYLRRIKQFYANEQIVYVRHPRESLSILNEISEKMNFKIVSFDVPIEYQFVINGVPKEMASFFCSAIENCRIIFGR